MTDTCGAIKKDGTPCKQMAIYSNGRCKFHGGLATGPTSEAGKEQSRINGRKGGRPRKDGTTSTTGKVSVMGNASFPLSDTKVLQRVPESLASTSSAAETEIMETDKTIVSEAMHGVVSGRVFATELQEPVRPESTPEKPKSWMLRQVMVFQDCPRCANFAGGGRCLAVARGVIPSMPTGDCCQAFSPF